MKNDTLTDSCEGCWLSKCTSVNFCRQGTEGKEGSTNIHISSFSKGENLIKSGMPAMGVYCIRKGKVKAYQAGEKGQQFILRILGPHEITGLSSMSNNDTYNCSATALEDVTACFIKMPDLKNIIETVPEVREKIMKDLSSRLKLMEQRIVSISKKNIKEQVAEILMSEVQTDKFGYDNYAHYSLRDIARLIGTDKKYLYKIVAELTGKKILSVQKHKIVINNLKALAQIAQGEGSAGAIG